MKIIVPTNDRLTIAPDFENAKSYLMIFIMNGIINKEFCFSVTNDLKAKNPFGIKEMKDVNNSDIVSLKGEDIFNQQIALTLAITPEAEDNLRELNYLVIQTEERNIKNALASFLRNHAVRESDYCCCP